MLSALGVLFDGLAYGCLLFLIGIGLSVTMGLMRFINLAHGAFAMAGGYVCVVLMNRRHAVPGHAADRLPGRRRRRLRAGAHAVPAALSREPARPGAVLHRARLHGHGGRHLCLGAVAAAGGVAGRAARATARVR
uniref:Branched-chain amino acid ABC transporter permease n=1 Tax=Ralstonia solanacearum TaxID=305 RepID=A0A0S4TVM0_RALSL|nr:protein of unknown function [Ralstonia solanacearum]